ncbi:phosphate ABC transporter permease PstA [Rhabdaerophilum calidifontis]|uniref:phosphate ABC transporter permease PstA n=1 Tax=Rhabdaerophilum calidifontis TaxID=2604328 RepID=UPI00123AB8F3|nr:phosphate ABC transporter permease PstA [Rhabdaerophilum calidifontis]
MTDLAAPPATSIATPPRRLSALMDQSRIRARYRSEARFRSYGLIALGLTTLFLVFLLADIFRNGVPAFWQHHVVLEVTVPREAVTVDGKVDAQSIRAADYFPITRDALKAAIPGIESRSGERTLVRLLSTGAADELRARLAADPSLVGKPVKTRLLLSDDADLYFKQPSADISERAARGIATPNGTTGTVTILSSANDFADDIVRLKQVLTARLRAVETEHARLSRAGGSDSVLQRLRELDEERKELAARVSAPKVAEDLNDKLPSLLVAINGGLVKVTKLEDIRIEGEVLLPLASTADAAPGSWKIVTYAVPASNRKVSDQEVAFLERLKADGKVESAFNTRFFTAGDSREPELAGVRGALMGTALTLLVTLALCLPIGVLAAIYLEEFARKNWFTDIIEININNLAAVPSIVFGLLGLAVFLNFFGLPRSAPLVGGLVLALLVLPTIIIAARAALKAVPPSIKEAALGVGASHQQAVFHHVLPLAMPGIMTGTIIGMAHALGETAPLLMIGMIAFIVDVPQSFTQAATVLPVQIYLWSDLPEQAFQAKTAAAIIVLLMFLFLMNGAAIWLRKRFERRW